MKAQWIWHNKEIKKDDQNVTTEEVVINDDIN